MRGSVEKASGHVWPMLFFYYDTDSYSKGTEQRPLVTLIQICTLVALTEMKGKLVGCLWPLLGFRPGCWCFGLSLMPFFCMNSFQAKILNIVSFPWLLTESGYYMGAFLIGSCRTLKKYLYKLILEETSVLWAVGFGRFWLSCSRFHFMETLYLWNEIPLYLLFAQAGVQVH